MQLLELWTVRGVLETFLDALSRLCGYYDPWAVLALGGRQFYGNAWKYKFMQGVEKSYLLGGL